MTDLILLVDPNTRTAHPPSYSLFLDPATLSKMEALIAQLDNKNS